VRRPGIVLQARTGSARLPGKVLAPIAGQPLVAHCLSRLSASGLPVVLATTARSQDDELCAAAERLGFPVVRGSEHDVLARYLLAAAAFELTDVVRATADNPAVDLDAARRTLDLLWASGADYVVEAGLPIGAAVEACTVAALGRAGAAATHPYDREHVTPFLRRGLAGPALEALAPPPLCRADLRLTVDHPSDLAAMRALYGFIGDGAPGAPLSAFIEAADALRGALTLTGASTR
jgi:spore coat polysaccharide biosynthesis protein SpsF